MLEKFFFTMVELAWVIFIWMFLSWAWGTIQADIEFSMYDRKRFQRRQRYIGKVVLNASKDGYLVFRRSTFVDLYPTRQTAVNGLAEMKWTLPLFGA